MTQMGKNKPAIDLYDDFERKIREALKRYRKLKDKGLLIPIVAMQGAAIEVKAVIAQFNSFRGEEGLNVCDTSTNTEPSSLPE
jgi:hypothetical protein